MSRLWLGLLAALALPVAPALAGAGDEHPGPGHYPGKPCPKWFGHCENVRDGDELIVEDEPEGENCEAGGVRITLVHGKLDEEPVEEEPTPEPTPDETPEPDIQQMNNPPPEHEDLEDEVFFVCNGLDGEPGEPGEPGADGPEGPEGPDRKSVV